MTETLVGQAAVEAIMRRIAREEIAAAGRAVLAEQDDGKAGQRVAQLESDVDALSEGRIITPSLAEARKRAEEAERRVVDLEARLRDVHIVQEMAELVRGAARQRVEKAEAELAVLRRRVEKARAEPPNGESVTVEGALELIARRLSDALVILSPKPEPKGGGSQGGRKDKPFPRTSREPPGCPTPGACSCPTPVSGHGADGANASEPDEGWHECGATEALRSERAAREKAERERDAARKRVAQLEAEVTRLTAACEGYRLDAEEAEAELAELRGRALAEVEDARLARAVWKGADSIFEGTIQSRFTKRNGKQMVVLEDDRGLLHIYPDSERLERRPGQ